jgi:hypothetical protein
MVAKQRNRGDHPWWSFLFGREAPHLAQLGLSLPRAHTKKSNLAVWSKGIVMPKDKGKKETKKPKQNKVKA